MTRALFEFCGLAWSEQTARFLRSSTTRSRDDYYSVFKDPLASAWRWQAELSAEDAADRRPRHRGFCAGAALFCVR